MDRNVLIDGNNVLHRAYAVFVKDRVGEDVMTSPGGYPTGLTYGFMSMISDWIQAISNPTRMAFFLDGVPRRRLAIDPDYKKKEEHDRPGRIEAPLVLSDGYKARNELDVIIHLMSLLGADLYQHEDEEADDLVASYVRSHMDDMNVVISSDKDFYQMLSWGDRIILYRPGVKGNRFFDAERAEEDLVKKYKLEKYGVRLPPSSVRMFKTLTGDASDGIVGVPRLRKKVAAPLCHHLSVADLYATGFPGFSGAEKKRANELRERIEKNFELVGLHDDIDLSPIVRKAAPDFKMASRILRDDLGMHTVFAHSFKFGRTGKVRLSPSTSYDLLPDFLKGI